MCIVHGKFIAVFFVTNCDNLMSIMCMYVFVAQILIILVSLSHLKELQKKYYILHRVYTRIYL